MAKLNSEYTTTIMYSYDVEQCKHEESGKNKGHMLKSATHEKFLEKNIKEDKYSPEACLNKIKQDMLVLRLKFA